MVAVTLGTLVGPDGRAHAGRAREVEEVERIQDLIASVPEDHRATCARTDQSDFADGTFEDASALITCFHPTADIESVVYAQYEPDDVANQFDGLVPDDVPEGSGEQCPSTGTWHYGDQVDAPTAGQVACFLPTASDGTELAWVVWTNDELGILGQAVNVAADGAAAKRWWLDSSGPLAEPDAVTGFADLTPAGRKASGRRLIRQAGSTTTNCKLRDAVIDGEYTPDTAEWHWLPWLAAEVICKAPRKGAVYYMQLTPETAPQYWNQARLYLSDEEYGPEHPAVCDEPQPVTNGGKQIGEVQCWYYHQTLWASWYDQRRGVVALITANVSPKQLYDYLEDNDLV